MILKIEYIPFFIYSFENNIFKRMGLITDEIIIRKITEVKYTGDIIPTARPFWETISATSPRVIIPTPTFRLSRLLYPQIFAITPQPIILVIIPTITNANENSSIDILKLSMFVFNPILAKNNGPNII